MKTIRIPVPPTYVDVIADGQIADYFLRQGKYEPETLAAWGRVARKGSEVFDVGSNIGIFAIAAAKLGARPVAIEPMPRIVERLKENARLNGVEFLICEAAASDKKGEAEIGYRPDVHLPYGASLTRSEKPDHGKLTVKTVRLDDFKMSQLSAIKIDVERYEITVLKGALKTLVRERPVIILEALNDRAVRKTTSFLRRTHRLTRTIDRRNLLFAPR